MQGAAVDLALGLETRSAECLAQDGLGLRLLLVVARCDGDEELRFDVRDQQVRTAQRIRDQPRSVKSRPSADAVRKGSGGTQVEWPTHAVTDARHLARLADGSPIIEPRHEGVRIGDGPFGRERVYEMHQFPARRGGIEVRVRP